MSENYTIQTTLEKLDKKPALWKGLTIDELMMVCGVCACGSCAIFVCILIPFGQGMLGMIAGLLCTLAIVPIVAGRVEDKKKKYGADLLWVTLKTNIQRRGFWRFEGIMTDKVRWGVRLSKVKSTKYIGPKNIR